MANLTVPAAEANRSFSKLLRAVRDGARITITSHGQPVAELGPVADSRAAEQQRIGEAHRRLMEHLRSVTPVVVGPWTRDELYERD
jgi:prevent-host-death family protein